MHFLSSLHDLCSLHRGETNGPICNTMGWSSSGATLFDLRVFAIYDLWTVINNIELISLLHSSSVC
jgi:hypothetical protein